MRPQYGVYAVSFSPDGRTVLTGSWNATARLWRADNGAPIGTPMQHNEGLVSAVAFSPDGNRPDPEGAPRVGSRPAAESTAAQAVNLPHNPWNMFSTPMKCVECCTRRSTQPAMGWR